MASSNQGSQAKGIYVELQALLANHINSLEEDKMAKVKEALKQAEEAKQEQIKTNDAIKKAKSELALLDVQKLATQAELEKLDEAKKEKNLEQSELNEHIAKKQADLDEMEAKEGIAGGVLSRHEEEMNSMGADKSKSNTEIAELNKVLAEKRTQLTSLENEMLASKRNFEESGSKVSSNQVLVDKLMEESKSLMAGIESLKAAESNMVQKKTEGNMKLVEFLADIEDKKKVAQATLDAVLLETKKHQETIGAEKQAVENEMLFVKKMNDINAQKNKSLVFAKDKLKEIIANSIPEVGDEKQLDFKNLLSVIEKL